MLGALPVIGRSAGAGQNVFVVVVSSELTVALR